MALRRHDLCGPRPPPKASHLKPGVHRNREERRVAVRGTTERGELCKCDGGTRAAAAVAAADTRGARRS